ncbi:hypothetical protein ACFYZJ_03220 [Streptomyces sp. NPDC001848]|uniref:hypothetical protein n=1 Tax=Streptomyces sp. NPDC001848 TaxID=3364618 RepID=UPI0036AE043A
MAYLCEHLRSLTDDVAGKAHRSRWNALLDTVRTGAPGSAAWREGLDGLDRLLREAGLPSGLGLNASRGPGDLLSPWQPLPQVDGWVCPLGACSRIELARGPYIELPSAPECALRSLPMRQRTL